MMLLINAFFLFNSIFHASASNNNVWTLTKIDLNEYPLAQCLDGSAAGFWFLPGSESGLDKFMIHHQGEKIVIFHLTI